MCAGGLLANWIGRGGWFPELELWLGHARFTSESVLVLTILSLMTSSIAMKAVFSEKHQFLVRNSYFNRELVVLLHKVPVESLPSPSE